MTLLVLLALCSFRLTRLVVVDAIADRPRTWLQAHAPGIVAEALRCSYCSGVWLSALVVLAADLGGVSIPAPLLMFGAVTGAQSLLAAVDDRLTD